jgi:hypothetical protein
MEINMIAEGWVPEINFPEQFSDSLLEDDQRFAHCQGHTRSSWSA